MENVCAVISTATILSNRDVYSKLKFVCYNYHFAITIEILAFVTQKESIRAVEMVGDITHYGCLRKLYRDWPTQFHSLFKIRRNSGDRGGS
jgi:hypothetical protein